MKMNFGQALEAIKNGKCIARNGWNGKGMFVYLVTGGNYPVQMDCVKHLADENGTLKYNPYMAIKNVNGTISTWVPSVNDCLAEDWYVLATDSQDKPCYEGNNYGEIVGSCFDKKKEI